MAGSSPDKSGGSAIASSSQAAGKVKGKPVFLFNRDWIFGVLLVVAVFASYQPAWNGKPIWDDATHITAPALRSLHGLAQIWTHIGATQQYYPLVHTVFWLEYRLWGDAPLGYHFFNIFLHFFSVLLLVKILRYLKVPGAWLAGAIFALHPIEVESVAWITEIKNVLSGLFFFGSMLAYLMFDRDRKKKLYAAAFGLFVFGLLSKSVVVTMPIGLIAIFWWNRGKFSLRYDVAPLMPFLAIGIVAGLFTAWVERVYIGAAGDVFNLTVIERCLVAGRTFWFYLGKILWPGNLIFIYPRWQVSQTVWWQYFFPAAAIILAAALWAVRRRSRAPFAVFCYYMATLFPALGFFNVYPFRYSFVADHFQYLAGIGPVVLAAAGLTLAFDSLRRMKPRLKSVMAVILLLALGGLTWNQTHMYRDIETLYRTTIKKNPGCSMAYNNLGQVLEGRGDTTEAMTCFEQALKNNADLYEAYNNLGNLLQDRGRTIEAIENYRKAIALSPAFAKAHYNLGNALLHAGQVQEAIVSFQRAIDIKPGYAEAHNNLGNALLLNGQRDAAIAEYQEALKTDFASVDANFSLGNAMVQLGRLDEAIACYRKAVAGNPQWVEAQNSLAYALMQSHRPEEAIDHYLRALERNPSLSGGRYNLASAYLQTRQIEAAIEQYQLALEAVPDDFFSHFNLANALMQAGRTDEAIVHYKEALKGKPGSMTQPNGLPNASAVSAPDSAAFGRVYFQLLNNLAAAYIRAGQRAEAVPVLEKALELAKKAGRESLAKDIAVDLAKLRLKKQR